MKKKLIQKINYFMVFIFYIILIVSCFINNRYQNYNVFEKIFSAPIYELTYWFSRIFDVRIAFFFTFIIGIIILYPIFISVFSNMKRMIIVWKKIFLISKQQVNNDEEQIAKVQNMLEVYEKEGISFLNIIVLIICSFLGVFFLKAMLGDIFYSELFKNSNWNVLWFSLNSKDSYFILPSVCFMIMAIIPCVKNIIKIKKSESEYNKTYLIVQTLIIFAGTCLLAYPILYSSIFAIFILITNLLVVVRKIIKKLGDDSNEKFINKN